MEQGLSFLSVVGLMMVGVVLESSIMVLATFLIGSIYLLIRGKKKGWTWRR